MTHNNHNTNPNQPDSAPKPFHTMVRKIGGTTYTVRAFHSHNAREYLTDILLRLMRNDPEF